MPIFKYSFKKSIIKETFHLVKVTENNLHKQNFIKTALLFFIMALPIIYWDMWAGDNETSILFINDQLVAKIFFAVFLVLFDLAAIVAFFAAILLKKVKKVNFFYKYLTLIIKLLRNFARIYLWASLYIILPIKSIYLSTILHKFEIFRMLDRRFNILTMFMLIGFNFI